MTYLSVLKNYKPKEKGNFFRLYQINSMQYVIYSPSPNDCKCIELCTFQDITPLELALFINDFGGDENNREEFEFEYAITRDDIINYLFDVENINNDNTYDSYISINSGYLMEGKDGKKTNIFEIGSEENRLIFDNSFSYQIFKKLEEDVVNICFNPISFKKLLNNKDICGTVFLLANTSDYILDKIDPDKEINIFVDTDYLHSLFSFIYFFNSSKENNDLKIYTDDKQICVGFSDEYEIENLINMLTICEGKLRSYVGQQIKSCFSLKVQDDKIYILFRNTDLVIKAFLSGLTDMTKKVHLIF